MRDMRRQLFIAVVIGLAAVTVAEPAIAPEDPMARQGHGRAGGDLLVPARQIPLRGRRRQERHLRFGRGSDGKTDTRDDKCGSS
jgi:hypothetical protein